MNVQLARSVLLRRSTGVTTLSKGSSIGLRSNPGAAAALSSLAGSWSLQTIGGNTTSRIAPQRRAYDSVSAHLTKLLDRELSEERENESSTLPPELVELKSEIEANWRIVEDDSTATVKLISSSNSPKVSVVFHCQDTVEEDVEDYGDDEEQAVAVRFTVLVSKAGKTMVLTCISDDAEARVESVAMTNSDADAVATGGIDSNQYQGPEFSELQEDLRDEFTNYVQTECGVDTNVACFVSMYSDYKEQTEYVRWLEQVKSMVS